jgi:endonuclease YncB( thermonuclease family)
MRGIAAVIFPLLAAVAIPAASQDRRQAGREPQDCAASHGELPKSWEGEAYAVDGDTVAGIGLKFPVRLWGIQAPELRDTNQSETIAGMRARAALEDILAAGEHRVSCQVVKWDRSCQLVAQCTIVAEMPRGTRPGPHDVALRLLEDGLAYGFSLNDALPWDANASGRYAHFEAIARQARKGLWPDWLGQPEPMAGTK